jgi:hypothetical protein
VEGASFDPARRVLYMAISDVGSGMTNAMPPTTPAATTMFA